MSRKPKRWSDLKTQELADATREFDDPAYDPPVRKPSKRQLAQVRQLQRKAIAHHRARIAVALDASLIEQADNYAAAHGVTFSDLVADALRQRMRKKSA